MTMDFFVPIQIPQPDRQISYRDPILLSGSCFTEHIGGSLAEHKFTVLQNPNGILFDPLSICNSLYSYIENKKYQESDLFFLNDVWNSWDHHSRFSHQDKGTCLEMINQSQQQAHAFLKNAGWLILTFGTSFSYRLVKGTIGSTKGGRYPEGYGVANCHRAPAQWFVKTLLPVEEIKSMLFDLVDRLRQYNPALKIILTVSPVRHIRDGVVDNNRSKARLIECVHELVGQYNEVYYFPAYELVIDVLRDYRFYDADLVHPNYAATAFVLEKFREAFIEPASVSLMDEVRKVVIARKHRPMHPGTPSHRSFLESSLEKANEIQHQHPEVDLRVEKEFFQSSLKKL